MPERIQETLSQAVLAILRPLVRILLRNGIAYGSFAELAKKVYVDVAYEEFVPEGKKQSISRVSALTGLTRKEARRLHELEHTDQDSSAQRYNRAVRVISGWVNDADFHDASGRPADLPVEGPGACFATLVRKYSGDVTTQSMLAVLTLASSVEKAGDKVRLIQHAFVPGNDAVDKLAILGTDTAELIATIDHNLVNDEPRRRFQRKVSDHQVSADAVPEFRALASKKSQALLEEFDAWLARHKAADGEQGQYVSLGIYFYERLKDKEDHS